MQSCVISKRKITLTYSTYSKKRSDISLLQCLIPYVRICQSMSILKFLKKKIDISTCTCYNNNSQNNGFSMNSCLCHLTGYSADKYFPKSQYEENKNKNMLKKDRTMLTLSSRLNLKRLSDADIKSPTEKKICNELNRKSSMKLDGDDEYIDNSINIKIQNFENEQNTTIKIMKKPSELENDLADENDNHDLSNNPYYLTNFKYIIQCVFQNDDDDKLFNEEDKSVVHRFLNLSDSEQKLFVRLFQRKNKWLRSNKVDYPEIAADITTALQNLFKNNFLLNSENLNDVECALNLLTIPEIRSLTKSFQIKCFQKGKKEMINILIKHGKQSRTVYSLGNITNVLLKRAKSAVGECYKLDPIAREIFIRMMILFSLTNFILNEDEPNDGLQQQLFTLLMVNTGKIVFPEYKINRKTVLFKSRDDFISFVNTKYLENEILQKIENKKFEDALQVFYKAKEEFHYYSSETQLERDSHLPVFLRNFTTGHIYIRCLTHGVDILQRLRKYKEAVKLLEDLLAQKVYRVYYRGYWWDRLALNLDQHLKQPEKSMSVILRALEDEYVRYGHRLNLHNRAKRLSDSLTQKYQFKFNDEYKMNIREIPQHVIKGRLLPRTLPGRTHLFISSASSDSLCEGDIEVIGVEELVLEYYSNEGFIHGIHGEGSTFISLFCLYFWDEIYECDIPDAFLCQHQTFPLDLNSDAFFKNRKLEIEKCLRKLRDSSIEELVNFGKVYWEKHKNKTCLIQWEKFINWEQMESLIRCLGNNLLVGICKRLAENFRYCRSGAPDLVIWNPNKSAVKFVEVKGPGDQLSSKQILWLDYLLSLGADAEVCYVEAVSSKKLKNIK